MPEPLSSVHVTIWIRVPPVARTEDRSYFAITP